jgi:hypothetical protein
VCVYLYKMAVIWVVGKKVLLWHRRRLIFLENTEKKLWTVYVYLVTVMNLN